MYEQSYWERERERERNGETTWTENDSSSCCSISTETLNILYLMRPHHHHHHRLRRSQSFTCSREHGYIKVKLKIEIESQWTHLSFSHSLITNLQSQLSNIGTYCIYQKRKKLGQFNFTFALAFKLRLSPVSAEKEETVVKERIKKAQYSLTAWAVLFPFSLSAFYGPHTAAAASKIPRSIVYFFSTLYLCLCVYNHHHRKHQVHVVVVVIVVIRK